MRASQAATGRMYDAQPTNAQLPAAFIRGRVSSGYSNAQCQGNAMQRFSTVCSKRRPRRSDAHASFTGRERDAHAGTQADRLRRHARPIGRIACCSVARRSRLSMNSIATVADRCHRWLLRPTACQLCTTPSSAARQRCATVRSCPNACGCDGRLRLGARPVVPFA